MLTWKSTWRAVGSATVLALLLGGCAADDGDGGGATDRAMADGAIGSGDGGVGALDGSASPRDGSSSRPMLEACKHLDILFSVDTSGSMSEERAAMGTAIFPAIARAMLSWEGVDFRVGVNDACPSPAEMHTAGTTGECGFTSGQPWMESSSPALVEEFGCVGDMYGENAPEYGSFSDCTGDNSDNEAPAHTLASMVEAEIARADGFVRDESLLVLVPITDEDEDQPNNYGYSPREVYDRIVAAAGSPRRVFFLAIAGNSDCDGVYGGAEEAAKLRELAGYFAATGNGAFWDLCGGSLDDGVTAALTLIREACDNIPPCDEFAPGSSFEDCYPPPDDLPDAGEPPLI